MLAEYEAQVAAAEDAMIEQGLDPDSLEGQDQLAQLRTDVLDLLIDRTLISQAAAAMGIAVSETELATRVAADIEVGGGQAAFEEWLQTTGQSQSNYTEIVRLALLEQRVFEAVTADVGEQNEQVRASHIQVASAEAAQEILDLLRGGADFGELAVQWSMDETTRDSGGDLGWIPRGVLARELEDVAFSLKPGEVGGPVQVGAAFHVIKVLEQEAARPLSPEMQLTLRQAAFEEWLAGRRSSAIIERVAGD